jgi:hypothetical protein
VYTEARTVLRAIITVSTFTAVVWRSLQITVFGTSCAKLYAGSVLGFLCLK